MPPRKRTPSQKAAAAEAAKRAAATRAAARAARVASAVRTSASSKQKKTSATGRVVTFAQEPKTPLPPPPPPLPPQSPPESPPESPTPAPPVSPIHISSPPPPSSPPKPEEPQFEIEITYIVRVNEKKIAEDSEVVHRAFFVISSVEDMAEKLVERSVDGKEYKWLSRTVRFKPGARGASWKVVQLKDFNFAEEARMWSVIDAYVRRFKQVEHLEMKLELCVQVEVLQRAFSKKLPEPSSDPAVITTPSGGYRTAQLIKESRTADRVREITAAMEHHSALTRAWECRVEACLNYGEWCYMHPDGSHYKIKPIDIEAWARSIIKGESSIMVPDHKIVETLKLGGNKLKVNPHTRRREGKKKRRQDSSDSSSDREHRRFMKTLSKEIDRQRVCGELERIKDLNAQRETTRETRNLIQMQQQQATVPFVSHPLAPPVYPTAAYRGESFPPAVPRPATPHRVIVHAPAGASSPVTQGAYEDSRKVVKEFFKWLIAQQDEEDQEDFAEAGKIAVEQRWTVGDLREMAKPGSELHKLALTFGLKDGIVRHLREDLRRFKTVYRAANGLVGLGGGEGGDAA